MKRLPLVFIVLLWVACTSPVKVNNEIQVSGATLLYQADEITRIKALSVSPGDGKIAFISQQPELDLVSRSVRNAGEEQTISQNLFSLQSGRTVCLSPGAQKVAVVGSDNIIVRDIASRQQRSYSLTGKNILQGKWSAAESAFYVLADDPSAGSRQIIRLNLADGGLRVLAEGAETLKLFDVNSAQNTFCMYEESAAGRQVVFTRPGRAGRDSILLASPLQRLALAHNGRQIIWCEQSPAPPFNVFLYDDETNQSRLLLQTQREVLSIKWSPDDSKILLLHPRGWSVFGLQNFKIDANVLIADSTNEIRMSPQWAAGADKIYFIKENTVNRLNLFTMSAGNSLRSMRINIAKGYSMDWDRPGRRVLLNEGQSVLIHDLENESDQRLNLPLHAVTPVHWGGPQGRRLTFVSDEGEERHLVLWDAASGDVQQFAMEGLDSVKDIAWLHGYEYVSFIIPRTAYMFVYRLGAVELEKVKVAPGDIRKVCWAPEDAPLVALNGEYAAVQGEKALGIYYYNPNYIYWLSHLTPLNAAYFAWNQDGKNLIYVTAEEAGAQQVFMEQVIYLNN